MGSKPVLISASRGAAILGESDYSSPAKIFQLIMEELHTGWNARHGYTLPEPPDNAAIRWGSAFEDAGVKLAENKQGCSIYGRETFYCMPNKSYVTCHIDGNYETRKKLHEFKTTSYWNWKEKYGEPGTDRVPRAIQIQAQHQMLCTGATENIISVLCWPRRVEEWEDEGIIPAQMLNGGYRFTGNFQNISIDKWAESLNEMGYFHQYSIKANPELQALMITAYTDFWNNHILTETPPTATTYDDIRRLTNNPSGTVIATDEIANLISEYAQIVSETGKTGYLKKRQDQIKVQVLNYCKNILKTEDDIKAHMEKESMDRLIVRSLTGERIMCYTKGIFRVSKESEE
jgi:predicted phage-related endonuclease